MPIEATALDDVESSGRPKAADQNWPTTSASAQPTEIAAILAVMSGASLLRMIGLLPVSRQACRPVDDQEGVNVLAANTQALTRRAKLQAPYLPAQAERLCVDVAR